MTTVTTIKPYMVGPGNHEANCLNGAVTDSTKNISYNTSICMPGQTNFTGFINHFRMPSQESNGTGNFWYSYDRYSWRKKQQHPKPEFQRTWN